MSRRRLADAGSRDQRRPLKRTSPVFSSRNRKSDVALVPVIEDGMPIVAAEVEHAVDRAGDGVERAVADPLAAKPVVLDEADDRALIGDRVIDVVRLRPRRDHQQRQPRTVAAAPLRVRDAVGSRQRRRRPVVRTDRRRSSDRRLVSASSALVEWLTIGPIWWSYQPSESSYAMTTAVSHHSGRRWRKLMTSTMNACSSSGSELLGVAVLVSRRLEEAHGREVPSLHGGVEVMDVVLVIGARRRRGRSLTLERAARAWDFGVDG